MRNQVALVQRIATNGSTWNKKSGEKSSPTPSSVRPIYMLSKGAAPSIHPVPCLSWPFDEDCPEILGGGLGLGEEEDGVWVGARGAPTLFTHSVCGFAVIAGGRARAGLAARPLPQCERF